MSPVRPEVVVVKQADLTDRADLREQDDAPAGADGDVPVLASAGHALGAAVLTAVAYAAVGALALMLAGPPGYASPLYPSAGIALVAVLVWGPVALPGVLLGALVVNAGVGWLRGADGLVQWLLPAAIGIGAALQAAVGAALVRRFVSQPLVLNAPHDIWRFGLLGAVVACTVSATLATAALLAAGTLLPAGALANWLTWWVGDAMGVLIGAPLVLTLIGRPRGDWRPRRRTLGVPLLLALALLAGGMSHFARLDRQRLAAAFESDADRLAAEAVERLVAPLHALQALHSAFVAHPAPDAEALRRAARWWLLQPLQLRAMAYSERVPLDALPAYEAAARGAGDGGYTVFDRDDGAARRADGEVVALRHIEPMSGNASAVGINALSIPAARAAIMATRDSGEPAATAGFRLTQQRPDQTGVVIYQALYHGEPTTLQARRAQFRGLVLVSLSMDATMGSLQASKPGGLRWCLMDADPAAERRQLAGEPGCFAQVPEAFLRTRRSLVMGSRPVELHMVADPARLSDRRLDGARVLALSGLVATAMLGALLLTVTGHTRRTQLAVHAGTAELRREMRERSQAQRALADSETRLRSILDHVPLGVMFLDPRGQLIDGNPRLAEMLGQPIGVLHGRQITDFVNDEDAPRLRRLRRRLLVGAGDAVLDRVPLLRKPGHELTVRLSASALRGPDGRMLRMVAVVEDITEYLRLEESERALHRAEAANRAKSDFLSRMSHELRTPLNAMIGFAQLLGLDREPALLPHQREWTEEIQRAGWHLLEMINETLDLARIESGAAQLKLAPLALVPLVKACQAMVAHAAAERGIAITQHIDADAAAVIGDATRLKQVLINLLSNAVKYNHPGGTVALHARRVRSDAENGDDRIEIAVADSGLGMTPTQLGGLFQPYNRLGREASDIEGTGVGLVISRRLAELMGGTLDVASQAAQGSVFTLCLPAAGAATAVATTAEPADTSPAPYQQRLVHYVEDNETNVEVMRGIFVQRPQIRLETTALGLDGLAAIRSNPPDLVLLDMQLPDISGLELLRFLKQDAELASIPVVVVSADAVAGHMQRALTSGAQHYITKPLDVARFLKTVDSILEQADTRWGL